MGRWTVRLLAGRAAAIGCALALTSLVGGVPTARAAANPSASWQPSAQTDDACGQAPIGIQCDVAALTDINEARAAEGVGPMILPTNYETLSQPQQMLVITNLERTARGLVPASGLSGSLDTVATVAALAQLDPNPQHFNGDAMASNWAGGFASPLLVDFYWMYDDGPGSNNFDCNAPTDPGCWDHRDNILFPYDAPLAFGAAEVSLLGGAPSVTELFVGGDQALLPGAVDALLGPTWGAISKSLQPLLSATALLLNGPGGTGSLRVTASSQTISIGARTTAGWQVSPSSCQLAAAATCVLTVTRTAGSTAGAGKLTLSGPAGTTTVPLSATAAAVVTPAVRAPSPRRSPPRTTRRRVTHRRGRG
jgi:hypothetical protein